MQVVYGTNKLNKEVPVEYLVPISSKKDTYTNIYSDP